MLTFLIYTFVFWIANIAFTKLAYLSIQPGQWFDMLFRWQERLNRWYESNSRFYNALAKIGGDCQQCFSVWLTFFFYLLYYLFCKTILHHWITDALTINTSVLYWLLVVLTNVCWYIAYTSIGSIYSFWAIRKRKK